MSATATLFAFSGLARCTHRNLHWQIEGIERDTRQSLSLLLVCVNGANSLPASATDLELQCMDVVSPSRWRLTWSSGRIECLVRSIHVQRAGSARLTAALPGLPPSWRGRAGWAVLLNLARMPGITHVLRALRGAD